MTIKHIPWPSISQFRDVVKNVQHRARYKGADADGNVIYNTDAVMPVLKFEGTVKLHGTNAAFCVDSEGLTWCQSKENVITVEKDNAGFAMFAEAHRESLEQIVEGTYSIRMRDDCDTTTDKTVVVFGEWAGSGIQKGMAISMLPKMFVIFGIALVGADNIKEYFTRTQVMEIVGRDRACIPAPDGSIPTKSAIYSIYDFPTFEIEIDFNNPHRVQNTLVDLTLAVEAECPAGKAFGVSGLGEGIVWRCTELGREDSGYWMKCKGELHSKTKVKTISPVDADRIDSINALAELVTPDWRLDQMLSETFDLINGGDIDRARTGEYLKNVMVDVLKECLEDIAASGFTTKDITGAVSTIARKYMFKQMEQSL